MDFKCLATYVVLFMGHTAVEVTSKKMSQEGPCEREKNLSAPTEAADPHDVPVMACCSANDKAGAPITQLWATFSVLLPPDQVPPASPRNREASATDQVERCVPCRLPAAV